MSEQSENGYRTTLRSTSIFGGATLVTILIGILRNKLLALLLGPASVGLIGLWTALLHMGTSVAGMGLSSSGVRQIATTTDDPEQAELSIRALWTLSFLAAVAGGGLLWLLREPLAVFVTGDPRHAPSVGWLALGLGLSIIAGAQVASIQGHRRIRDFAKLHIASNFVAAVVGVAAVAYFGDRAIVAVVLATPAAGCAFGWWYARKLPQMPRRELGLIGVVPVWRTLAAMGFAITAAAVLGSVGQILARTIVVRGMGLEAAGLFQAAWSISAVNIGLLLAGMGADYYPRLCGAADDRKRMSEIVNQQVHVALVLAGPVLVAVISLAPLMLWLLYSSEFTGATTLLQWFTAAHSLHLIGWAIGFVMLARQATLSYIVIESAFGILFVPLIWLLSPLAGLQAIGIAYFTGHIVSVALAVGLAASSQGVRVSGRNVTWTAILTTLLLALILGSRAHYPTAAVIGLIVSFVLSLHSVREIHRMGIAVPLVGPFLRKVGSRMS